MNCAEIRERFVNYYRGLGFQVLARAPLLHPAIPMSFVMSAGLVQVESSLARAEQRSSDQFVLVQECFRHFDLDKVGTDDTHLSMFEMPAAFVFHPNGKAETIQQLWTLTTSVLGIDKRRIWTSYFKGGNVWGDYAPGDDVTRQAWIKVGLPENRIVGLASKDNYWVQGSGIHGMESPRKAGPNTELFYDRGPERACGLNCRPPCRCGRFVEFSNTLFVCRELDTQASSIRPMEEPFAETVIGTERVAMILQGAESVFETDGYKPIVAAIRPFIRKADLPAPLVTVSQRVIADYAKALYLLITDGAPPPGKDGRERIVKLLLRGLMTRQIILGIESAEFLPTLIDCIAQTVHSTVQARPEDEKRLCSYFLTESRRFCKTVASGRRQLARLLEQNGGRTLSGRQIVFLEKNKGLPHLLTAMTLREKGLAFAEADYRAALEAWKQNPHH